MFLSMILEAPKISPSCGNRASSVHSEGSFGLALPQSPIWFFKVFNFLGCCPVGRCFGWCYDLSVGLMFRERIKRSNLDAKRDSNPFISFSIAEIRVLNAARDVLVVTDKVEVEDVELPFFGCTCFLGLACGDYCGGSSFQSERGYRVVVESFFFEYLSFAEATLYRFLVNYHIHIDLIQVED